MGAVIGIKVKDLVREALHIMDNPRRGTVRHLYTCLAVCHAEEALNGGDYHGLGGPACDAWEAFACPDGEHPPEWWDESGNSETLPLKRAALMRWAEERGEEVIY